MLHDSVVLAVAGMCVWFIISPRVPSGILGTTGLGVIAVAALFSLDVWARPEQIANTLFGGLGLIGASIGWRLVRGDSPRMRRLTDWSISPDDVDDMEHVHIVGGKR